MMQTTVSLDRRGADCHGSASSSDLGRPTGFAARLRALFQPSSREGLRATSPDPLSDHLLQDMGLSRADLQALSL